MPNKHISAMVMIKTTLAIHILFTLPAAVLPLIVFGGALANGIVKFSVVVTSVPTADIGQTSLDSDGAA